MTTTTEAPKRRGKKSSAPARQTKDSTDAPEAPGTPDQEQPEQQPEQQPEPEAHLLLGPEDSEGNRAVYIKGA